MSDKSNRFWYHVGATTGTIFRILIILACIYGVVTSLWNKEIPYIPVMLFLVYQMWSRIFVIHQAVVFLVNRPVKDTLSPSEIENLISLVNFRNMYGGGPN